MLTTGINDTGGKFATGVSVYIDDLRSKIFALLKSLKIWALENYVCLLRHTYTDLCQIVKTVLKT
jgi:hypothetical protein